VLFQATCGFEPGICKARGKPHTPTIRERYIAECHQICPGLTSRQGSTQGKHDKGPPPPETAAASRSVNSPLHLFVPSITFGLDITLSRSKTHFVVFSANADHAGRNQFSGGQFSKAQQPKNTLPPRSSYPLTLRQFFFIWSGGGGTKFPFSCGWKYWITNWVFLGNSPPVPRTFSTSKSDKPTRRFVLKLTETERKHVIFSKEKAQQVSDNSGDWPRALKGI